MHTKFIGEYKYPLMHIRIIESCSFSRKCIIHDTPEQTTLTYI